MTGGLPDDRITRAQLALTLCASPLLDNLDDAVPVRSAADSVVFKVDEMAAKVYAPDYDMVRYNQRMAVLAAVDGPWIKPLAPPVVTEAGTVTLWPWAAGVGTSSWPEIGHAIRRFHDLELPGGPLLRPWSPLRRTEVQMERYLHSPGADPDAAALMLGARAQLLSQVSTITSDLGYGVLHGDVHPGNVVLVDGVTTFIDLDMVCWGPKEYDLVGAAMRLRNGEIDEEMYGDFCDAYGYDVRRWSHLQLVEEIVDLGTATFLMGEDGAAALDYATVWTVRSYWSDRRH